MLRAYRYAATRTGWPYSGSPLANLLWGFEKICELTLQVIEE
jgi:hypothetical protein